MIPNPWVILGVVLAWLASLGAVGYWQHHQGAIGERVLWQGKQTEELAQANAKILALTAAARDKEAAAAADLAAIGVKHENELAARDALHKLDLDALRAGSLRLRVAGGCPSPGGGTAGEAPAASAGDHGSTACELPRQTSEDLLGLAKDADDTAIELASCQATVIRDRQ